MNLIECYIAAQDCTPQEAATQLAELGFKPATLLEEAMHIELSPALYLNDTADLIRASTGHWVFCGHTQEPTCQEAGQWLLDTVSYGSGGLSLEELERITVDCGGAYCVAEGMGFQEITKAGKIAGALIIRPDEDFGYGYCIAPEGAVLVGIVAAEMSVEDFPLKGGQCFHGDDEFNAFIRGLHAQ